MNQIGIYKITNPYGKIYIGQSTDLQRRFYDYSRLRCKDQPLIYNSFLKYGFEKHLIEIIIICDISELNDLERKYILKFNSNNRNFGLNLTSGGQDYFFHSEETKVKMSLAQIQKL